MFPRKLLKILEFWCNRSERLPLIILGARQVGKTSVVKAFANGSGRKIHVFDFEETASLQTIFAGDIDPATVLKSLEFAINQKINVEEDLIFFDEIQACGRALTSLKYFSEKMPQLRIIAAGSLLGLYLPEQSFPVGKVQISYLRPLDFCEFLQAISDERGLSFLKDWDLTEDKSLPEIVHQHLWQQLKTYFIVGGMPAAIRDYIRHEPQSLAAYEVARERQSQLVTMYLADIAKHSGRLSAMHIGRIWQQLPQQLAATIDASVPKYKFSSVIPGVKGYRGMANALDWLENAGLVLKIGIANCGQHPLSHYTKENVFKLFCFDIGLLGALSKLHPSAIHQYDYGTYKGYFAENFTLQELISQDLHPFSWAEASAEVEFLLEYGGQVVPIEVKSGWITQAKSLKVFQTKYKPKCSIVLSVNHAKVTRQASNSTKFVPLYAVSKITELLDLALS